MRTWTVTLLMLLLSSLSVPTRLAAQATGARILYSKHRHFNIPFNLGKGADRLKQLQLFYSQDKGQTWRAAGASAPDKNYFPFFCERDGLYWFAVQTLDKKGVYFPPNMSQAKPSLRVLVDTLPPVVQLRPLPVRGTRVGVTWQIREDYLDFNDDKAVRLEWRRPGNPRWNPLTINSVAIHHYWEPDVKGRFDVRLIVTDRAGNDSTAKTQVSADGNFSALPPDNPPNSPSSNRLPNGYANATNRRLINSKSIRLECEVNDVGPSGVSQLELWYTTDGRSWNLYPLTESAIKDLGKAALTGTKRQRLKKRLEFTVDQEGVYGFTILAKSGVGRSRRPPQIGEAPQIWVEVDETAPVVRLQDVQVTDGIEKGAGKLTIAWAAQDKNLGPDPIRISYAEKLSDPWIPIATDIANNGQYVWNMRQVPYQFYVRIECRDGAGNIGNDITRDVVKVDLSEPRVNILKVDRGGH